MVGYPPPVPHPIWPLVDLRVRTPLLRLRRPTDEDCVALAQLAAAGVHDPACMPFDIPWTDAAPGELEQGALRWWWRQRAEWQPERWTFTGAVFVDDQPVGVPDLVGEDVSRLRVVHTGSWLGRRFQGRGIGREMRAAILQLAFAGLGAAHADSSASTDNPASLAVSRALGSVDKGETVKLRRGVAARNRTLRLDRAGWLRSRRDDIAIDPLGPCLAWFGLSGAAAGGEPAPVPAVRTAVAPGRIRPARSRRRRGWSAAASGLPVAG